MSIPEMFFKLFNTDNHDKKQAACKHILDDSICIKCGELIYLCKLVSTQHGYVSKTTNDEGLIIPKAIDKKLIQRAFDLFGCIKTTQMRNRPKNVILAACLLYICDREDKCAYFYSNFHLFKMTKKDLIRGIDFIETLLPMHYNTFELDFKKHEIFLSLYENNRLHLANWIFMLYPKIKNCFNTLQVNSIITSCIILLKQVFNIDVGCGTISHPSCIKQVREMLLLWYLPRIFPQIFTEKFKTTGICCNETDIQASSTNGKYSVVKTGPTLKIYINHKEIPIYSATHISAWQELFLCDFKTAEGCVYNANTKLVNTQFPSKFTFSLQGN